MAVDNTFATPYLQQPLSLGADIVVHSATKYLGGHSDVVGGAIAVDDPSLADRLAFFQNAAGGVPGPMDCYLVLRGLKTLAVRMDRHCAGAAAVAEMPLPPPGRVRGALPRPGLPSRPRRGGPADGRLRGDGVVRGGGGEAAALEVARSTDLFTLAESLGAVESLIEHPGRMTHASAAGSPLEVDPGLVRLSVGIETLDDLIDDLERALAAAG